MPKGKGKYDSICEFVHEETKADAALVIVLNGEHGSGFSVVANQDIAGDIPGLLDELAANIRKDLHH